MSSGHPIIREIMTKAVCGNGSLKYRRLIDLEIPGGSQAIQVLGHYISNADLTEAVAVDKPSGKAVQVKGHFDVHAWYAAGHDTNAVKTTVTYIEYVPLDLAGAYPDYLQARAWLTQKPVCRKASVKSYGNKNIIRMEVEQAFAAETIGTVKLKVGLAPIANVQARIIAGPELIAPGPGSQAAPEVLQQYCPDPKSDEDCYDENEDRYSYHSAEYDF